MTRGGMLGAGPAHANGTRVGAPPVGGQREKKLLTEIDDPAATAYVTDPGLVCRPGNVVTIDGAQVEVQPEWWFPYAGDAKAVDRAVQLCRRCPARQRCLALAEMSGEVFGVWGGRLFERATHPPRPAKRPTPLYDQQGRRVS